MIADLAWGADGLARVPAGSAVAVVDVLRATSRLTSLAEQGRSVCVTADLASGNTDLSLAAPAPGHDPLVLASPNGAALLAGAAGAPVVAASLRNATAAAAVLAAAVSTSSHIVVVAAGERWGRGQGPLRPAVEDLFGAGAVLNALAVRHQVELTPDAEAAAAAFRDARADLGARMRSCPSGRELVEDGKAADVALASELDVTDAVPVRGPDGILRPQRPASAPGPAPVILITGISAAGKSTVADLLARRLPKAVHLRGDAFRKAVVSGRAEMSPDPSAEAVAQLELRHRLAASAADAYASAGFTVVVQDVVLGRYLPWMVGLIAHPVHVVVLAPSPAAVAAREAGRPKTAYRDGAHSIAQLDRGLRDQTPRIGHWNDSSALTPDETVDAILAEWS